MKKNVISLENGNIVYVGSEDYIQSVYIQSMRYGFKDEGYKEEAYKNYAVGLLVNPTQNFIRLLSKQEVTVIITENFCKKFDMGYTLIDCCCEPTIVGEYRPEVYEEKEDEYI